MWRPGSTASWITRVAVPRLQNARVRGARLHSVQGRDAAYISYEATSAKEGEQGQRIGVFVFDDTRRELDAQPQPSVHQDGNTGLNVAIWRDDEIVYELVTELNEADILKMLQERERGADLPPPSRSHEAVPRRAACLSRSLKIRPCSVRLAARPAEHLWTASGPNIDGPQHGR